MANSPSEFIDQIGTRRIADAVGQDIGVVRVWKSRNRFPRASWLHLATAFPELDLQTLEAFDKQVAA